MAESNLLGQQIQGYSIVRKLGSGGYGTVYLGEKEDLGKKYQTAIKHISMPDAEGYESVLQDYGYDKAATQAHFEKMVEGITAEINTLLELSKKDNRYIVAYYDHAIQRSYDPLRFEIFMRMEYLTPLNRHIRQKGMTLGDIIKLGLNMCDALALCHSSGVMHRDIKEANIFVSDSGNYKLGDFGVAKVSIETTQAGSIKGTASYMAPEIYLREPYDTSVDIYSLGIVLYKLLNNQRLPFMPDAPAQFTVDDKNAAETKRLKGDTPPLPANAKNRLGEIVVKACSAKTVRYAKAEEFKADLQEFLKTLSTSEYDSVVIAQTSDGSEELNSYTQNSLNSYTQTQGATMTMGAQSGNFTPPPPTEQNPYAKTKPKKKKGVVIASIVGALVIAAGVAGYIAYTHFTDPVNQFQTAVMEGDFTSAEQLYRGELKFGDSDKLEEAEAFIVNHAEDVKNKYTGNEIEYENALAQLQEMGKLGIVSSDELQPMISAINSLRTSRAAYENAQADITAGDWKSAIGELRKVVQEDSNYTEAQTQLADAVRSYKDELMGELSEFDIDKDYSGAISTLRAGLQVVPDDADFLTKIADYEQKISDEIELTVANIIQNANNAVATNADYQSALAELRDAAKQYPTIASIKDAIADVESTYTSAVFADVDTLVGEKKYDEAITLLNDLKADLSSDNEVLDKIAEVNDLKPIDLSQVVVIDSQDYDYNSDLYTDSFGNTYDGRHYFYAGSEGYAVYNLEGKFTSFSGLIVANQNTGSSASMDIAIYTDDTLAHATTGFNKRTGAVAFNVDVRGVTKLEIRTDGEGGWSSDRRLSIVNTQLEKQP